MWGGGVSVFNMSLGTWCRSMVPLNQCRACSLPEESTPSNSALRRQWKSELALWRLATWNLRTLLDVEGSIQTSRQGYETANAEDRRIDQLVSEFERYNVVVGGLQETKCLDRVGNSVVLTSGREIPGNGVVKQRGEGVALVLTGPAVDA